MKYNILFISSWLPSKIEQFNGDFVQRHAIAVSTRNKVEILHTIGDEAQKEKFIFEESRVEGIRKLVVYYRKSRFRLLNFIRRFQAYKLGFQKMTRPDIVHANVLKDNMLFAVYLKWKYRIPYVITEHWTIFQPDKKRTVLKLWIARFIANRAAYVLPVSNDLENCLKNLNIGKRWEVISNVVDTDLFCPPKIRSVTRTTNFLHISSLNSRKRPLVMIEQIIRLHQNGYLVSLEIGGNGDLVEIQELVLESNATEYIRCFGALSHAEVAEKMKTTDVFVLYSEQENLPCVLLEAMSSGVPFISSDVGGIREIVENGHGLLVNSKDPQDLYQTLEKSVKGEVEWAGAQSLHEFVVEHYSIGKIAGLFNTVYNKTLERNEQ